MIAQRFRWICSTRVLYYGVDTFFKFNSIKKMKRVTLCLIMSLDNTWRQRDRILVMVGFDRSLRVVG